MAEEICVHKSLYAIAGMGIAACCLLSLMMKQLVRHKVEQRPVPYIGTLAKKFADDLAGPVTVSEEYEGEKKRLVVHVRLQPGTDRQRLVEAIGAEVWKEAAVDPAPPAEVMISVRSATGGKAASLRVPRPTR